MLFHFGLTTDLILIIPSPTEVCPKQRTSSLWMLGCNTSSFGKGAMRVNVIRIPCKDLNQSTNFYQQSVGLQRAFGSPSDGYVGFQLENAQLLLETQEPGEFACGRYLGFSLEVEDLTGFYHECSKRGVLFTNAPKKQDWGGVMTHLKDCDGNTFSVVQQSD